MKNEYFQENKEKSIEYTREIILFGFHPSFSDSKTDRKLTFRSVHFTILNFVNFKRQNIYKQYTCIPSKQEGLWTFNILINVHVNISCIRNIHWNTSLCKWLLFGPFSEHRIYVKMGDLNRKVNQNLQKCTNSERIWFLFPQLNEEKRLVLKKRFCSVFLNLKIFLQTSSAKI